MIKMSFTSAGQKIEKICNHCKCHIQDLTVEDILVKPKWANSTNMTFRYSNGEVGEKPYIDSSWNPNPKDCFIGAICETYSHQPHLDDGASNANGKGRWRVWTAYQKKEDSSSFIDWELFLYNFRPTDINELNENATTAYMYDKTPPYQVCGRYYNAAYSGGELEQEWAAYYPKGKFFPGYSFFKKSKDLLDLPDIVSEVN